MTWRSRNWVHLLRNSLSKHLSIVGHFNRRTYVTFEFNKKILIVPPCSYNITATSFRLRGLRDENIPMGRKTLNMYGTALCHFNWQKSQIRLHFKKNNTWKIPTVAQRSFQKFKRRVWAVHPQHQHILRLWIVLFWTWNYISNLQKGPDFLAKKINKLPNWSYKESWKTKLLQPFIDFLWRLSCVFIGGFCYVRFWRDIVSECGGSMFEKGKI